VTEELRSETSPALDRAYRSDLLVRFAHCDPAGIVFYPRYLEMFNNVVEDWCRDELGISFAELIPDAMGLPTVRLEVDFIAPSTLGEKLQANLLVRAIGRTSFRLEILLRGPDGRDRVRGKVVLVMTDSRCKGGVPLSDELKERLSRFLVAD